MRMFHLASYLEDTQHFFSNALMVLWGAVVVMNWWDISPLWRSAISGILILFWIASQFEQHYYFTEERVEMYSGFHKKKPTPYEGLESFSEIFPQRSALRLFRRSIPCEALKNVTIHSTWYGTLIVVELLGCQPRYEESTWQYILHNRKNVLVIRAELPYAYSCYDLIEEYIADSLGSTNI